MVQGIHPRHCAVDGADVESKTGETCQQNSHYSNTGSDLPRLESSTRIRGRTSSTERRTRSEAVPVEPLHGAPSANYRRKSMELRSNTDKLKGEVVSKLEIRRHSSVMSSPVSPSGGRRRPSGSQQVRPEEIAHVTATSIPGAVECNAEQISAKPAPLRDRRHRGSIRHRRRMAARRRSKLLPLSTPQPNTSLDPPVHASQPNSCTEVAFNDSSELKVADISSDLVHEQKVCSSKNTSVSKVVDDTSCKMDSDVVQNRMECCHSKDGTPRPLPKKTSVVTATDVSAEPGLCPADVKNKRPKLEEPLSNLVPVMHVDLASRVGRRRRSQNGMVELDRYTSVDAACVMCGSCSQFLSVAEFLRHTHHSGRRSVESVRRLGPRGVAGPEWHEFQRRRVQFALVDARYVNPPAVDQVTNTTSMVNGASPGSADDKGAKKDITVESEALAVLAVDDVGKTENVENLPPVSVTNHDTSSTEVVKKPPPSTLVVGQGTKNTGTEKCPPPVLRVEVTKSISDDVTSPRPSEDVVVPVSCPATVVVPEPRLTRSRRTGVIDAESSPGVSSLRSQSSTVDIPAPVPRHSERTCKRVHMDSAAPTSTHRGRAGDSISSRVELRPRPPPRATAPK